MRRYARIIFLAALLGINALIWLWPNAHRGFLTVAFLDIGQGDSIYIEAPDGNQILIDGGPDTSVLRRLGEVMPIGDRSIDVVIGTHPDADHIGGLVDVLSRFSVDYVFEPGIPNDTATWSSFLAAANEKSDHHIIARRGMTIDLGSGVVFSILYPDKQITGDDTNLASIVGKLTFGKTSFMLTGDAPQSVEVHLITLDGNDLKSTVLKPGHHGSKTSSAPQFLDAVDPLYAVISAGKDNKYGHPHQQTIDALNARHITILSTITSGTIIFHSDGDRVAYVK
jgi:competence protein ComEC